MYAAQNILVIDVETTGLNPSRHACIEVGAVLLNTELVPIGEFTSMVAPWAGAEIVERALAVSGISRDAFLNARRFSEVIEDFDITFCKKGEMPIIAGWNVWFDVSFIRNLYERANLAWPFGHRFVDVQSVSAFFSKIHPSSQEKAIRDLLGETQCHRALADAKHTARILRWMAEKYLQSHPGAATTEQIIDWLEPS